MDPRRPAMRRQGSPDSCKTCRKRKVKCDGRRPSCRQCLVSQRQCEWVSWELSVKPGNRARRTISLDHQRIKSANVNSAQLLGMFLQCYFPERAPAAPSTGHMASTSLVHLWAQSGYSAFLPNLAIETLCVTYLASTLDEDWAVIAALRSRAQLFAALNNAIAAQQTRQPLCSAHDTILTIMLSRLLPALKDDPPPSPEQAIISGEGTVHFLAQYGPAIVAEKSVFTPVIIRQLRSEALFLGVVPRNGEFYLYPEWLETPNIVLAEDANFHKKNCWVMAQTSPQPALTQSTQATFARHIPKVMAQVPSFVRKADALAKSSEAESDELLADAAVHVRRFNTAQLDEIQPCMRDSTLRNKATADTLFADIEEHYILKDSSLIEEHFDFRTPQEGYASASLALISVVADCTLLRTLYTGMQRYDKAADWTEVDADEVELRAHASAYELCRHVHYYSLRPSLTAARYLRGLITAARNCFRSYGATDETRWCEDVLLATEIRMRRLKVSPSICPMVDIVAKLALVSYYDRVESPSHGQVAVSSRCPSLVYWPPYGGRPANTEECSVQPIHTEVSEAVSATLPGREISCGA